MSLYSDAKLYKTTLKTGRPDWYVYFQYRHPVTRKMKPFKVRAGLNYIKTDRARTIEGNSRVAEMNRILKEGWSPFSNHLETYTNLEDQLKMVMDLKKSTLRHRSYQSYNYCKNSLVTWIQKENLSYISAKDFTPVMAQRYFDSLLKKGLKGRSFNKTKGFLVTIFNMLVEREIIEKNPFRKIGKLPEEVGNNLAFSNIQKDELSKYLKERNPRLYLFTQFIYFCYIRPLELLRLKVSNIDLSKGMIFIHGSQSKNKKSESVIIPDAFMPLVKSMNLPGFPADDFLFGFQLQTCPEPYSRNSVTKYHKEALRALSIPDEHTMYSWKASGNIAAYQAGIDLYNIMRQNRHHALSQTQTYLKSLGLEPNTEFGSKMK